jgi:hypothetical protein
VEGFRAEILRRYSSRASSWAISSEIFIGWRAGGEFEISSGSETIGVSVKGIDPVLMVGVMVVNVVLRRGSRVGTDGKARKRNPFSTSVRSWLSIPVFSIDISVFRISVTSSVNLFERLR